MVQTQKGDQAVRCSLFQSNGMGKTKIFQDFRKHVNASNDEMTCKSVLCMNTPQIPKDFEDFTDPVLNLVEILSPSVEVRAKLIKCASFPIPCERDLPWVKCRKGGDFATLRVRVWTSKCGQIGRKSFTLQVYVGHRMVTSVKWQPLSTSRSVPMSSEQPWNQKVANFSSYTKFSVSLLA
jgi:hypothetical protein